MRFLAKLSHYCFCNCCEAVDKLIIPGLLTISLCLDFFCSGWLMHESANKNSLKLIYRVLKYAWQNKYPSKRSSFFLWDKSRCSRVDVAKEMFGGPPFTASEVEDVKTFWRILLFLVIGSLTKVWLFSYVAAENMSFHLSSHCPAN